MIWLCIKRNLVKYIKEYDNMMCTDYVFMRNLLKNLTQFFFQARNEKIMKFKTPINEETNQS